MVDLVLSGAHERLQQRCARDKIVEVLEEHGAYADNALRSLLSRRFDVIEKQLSDCDAAPPAFLTLLAEHLGSSSVDGTAATRQPAPRQLPPRQAPLRAPLQPLGAERF